MFLLSAEINLFCILIVVFLLFKVVTGLDMQNSQFIFVRVLISCTALFVMDFIWLLIGFGYIEGSYWLNYWVNAIYYILTGVTSYLWFAYSEHILGSKLIENRKNLVLCAIPMAVLVIMVLCSVGTGWIFYIDDDYKFHRGEYYLVQNVIAYGYIIFTSFKAFLRILDKRQYINHMRYKTLASFLLYTIFFGTFQLLMPGTPLINIGITMGMLNVYVSFQQQLILVDPLTQMNNRNQMMKYLSNKMQNLMDGYNLYLIIMDVDNFKKINDRYGRVEGDKALVQIASALKYVCIGQNYFTARYGGDEFIIICECASNDEVNKLYYRIQNSITRSNVNSGKPYGLSLSIGVAKYGADIDSIQDFINIADAELTKMKQTRKKHNNVGE